MRSRKRRAEQAAGESRVLVGAALGGGGAADDGLDLDGQRRRRDGGAASMTEMSSLARGRTRRSLRSSAWSSRRRRFRVSRSNSERVPLAPDAASGGPPESQQRNESSGNAIDRKEIADATRRRRSGAETATSVNGKRGVESVEVCGRTIPRDHNQVADAPNDAFHSIALQLFYLTEQLPFPSPQEGALVKQLYNAHR